MAEMLGLMTNRLTPEQLAQIRERAEKATEGPWKVADDNRDTEYFPFWVIGGDQVEEGEWFAELHVGHLDDANFIAHAREDIPKLLAEIDRLNERLEQAKEILDLDTVILGRIFGEEDAHDSN